METKSNNKLLNMEDKIKEIQQPYLYRLKSTDKNNEDEEYRYRILSNLLFTPYYEKDPSYLYIFGILPCELIPSAYIPLNYKNNSKNLYRLSKNDKFTIDKYKEIFEDDFNINDKKNIKDNLKKMLIEFESHGIYNFNYLPLTINIIILWTIIIFMIMYISIYYYAQFFNYVLTIIVSILLVFSIIWKMIYTLQN